MRIALYNRCTIRTTACRLVALCEASFIRLLDKICDGSDISINETGTSLRYRPMFACTNAGLPVLDTSDYCRPGQIVGGDGLVHNCPASRGSGLAPVCCNMDSSARAHLLLGGSTTSSPLGQASG
eukprot:3481929-Amphidinium_carterae.1